MESGRHDDCLLLDRARWLYRRKQESSRTFVMCSQAGLPFKGSGGDFPTNGRCVEAGHPQ